MTATADTVPAMGNEHKVVNLAAGSSFRFQWTSGTVSAILTGTVQHDEIIGTLARDYHASVTPSGMG
jgi:hypothetical protein